MVLWLLNFKLRIQCFQASLYSRGEDLFLTLEQVLPTKDAEEFMIGMADKVQDENQDAMSEKNIMRREFWSTFLKAMSDRSNLYDGGPPSKECVVGSRTVRAEVYINTGDRDANKRWFDFGKGSRTIE
jgi:hypothetical protein